MHRTHDLRIASPRTAPNHCISRPHKTLHRLAVPKRCPGYILHLLQIMSRHRVSVLAVICLVHGGLASIRELVKGVWRLASPSVLPRSMHVAVGLHVQDARSQARTLDQVQ